MIIRVIRVMQIVVLTNESLKEELLCNASSAEGDIIWIEIIPQLRDYKNADVFIDLLFEKGHITALHELLPKTVIINSVEETLAETDQSFVRINGWPTFLQSSIIEAASLNDDHKKEAEKIFSLFNKKPQWLPDETGFVTPRVVSMIINEAFISFGEGISTKNQIDTAMKLGTNYPYGPFGWAEKIGVKKISSLLQKLGKQNIRYKPSSLLMQESL